MLTMHEALEGYLTTNGFTRASYEAPTVEIPVGPITFKLPNTQGRKAVVRQHDLHHVLTGFGTDLVGEAEIAAFELRAGCTNLAAYVLNTMAAVVGLAIAPLRTVRAFQRSKGMTTLYRSGLSYEDTLPMSVTAVREKLGLPREGLATAPARLHRDAPRVPA